MRSTLLRKHCKTLSSLTALCIVLGAASQLGACSQDETASLPAPQPSTVAMEQADGGEPSLSHRTSWVGDWLLADDAKYRDESQPLDGDFFTQKRRYVQSRMDAIWVDGNGRIYTNAARPTEARHEMGIYQYDGTRPIGTDKGSLRPVADALALYPQGTDGTVVTGDGKYIYADALFQDPRPADAAAPAPRRVLVRFDPAVQVVPYAMVQMSPFDGGDRVASNYAAARNLPGKPGGLAAGRVASNRDFVFVSLPDQNEVRVYEREGMTLVKSYTIPSPGVMAFRDGKNSLFVAQKDDVGNAVIREWNVDASATFSLVHTVRHPLAPVGLAASVDKLYVANATTQQVAIFDTRVLIAGDYQPFEPLGQLGGTAAAKGQYADDRFDNLSGVGVDDDGNIYVASSGYRRHVLGRTDIRRFSPDRKLQAKAIKHDYQDTLIVDPEDVTKVYSATRKYALDYAQTTPGQEWSPNRSSITVDRTACPHDGRNPIGGAGGSYQTQAIALRHLKDGNGVARKYLYVRGIGSYAGYYQLGIYRFDDDDTIARPSVLFSQGQNAWPNGEAPPPDNSEWVDVNANCTMDPGEIKLLRGPVRKISIAQYIDESGGIWGIYGDGPAPEVQYFPIKSFDAKKNPVYFNQCGDAGAGPCTDNGQRFPLANLDMKSVQQITYVPATDTMYVLGSNPVAGTTTRKWRLARYDQFRTTPGAAPKWNVELGPYVSCFDTLGNDLCAPTAMAVAGRRIYVADLANRAVEAGRVRAYDAENAAYKGSLYAGPEVSRTAGYLDTYLGISAIELPTTKEHIVFREDDGLGRILMYRYTPTN